MTPKGTSKDLVEEWVGVARKESVEVVTKGVEEEDWLGTETTSETEELGT